MTDIDALIGKKEAAIAVLQNDVKALRQAKKIVESVSGASVRSVKVKRSPRAKRGAKKAKVLRAMSDKPQRMSVIAKEAGVSTANAASVLQAGVKRGDIKKGRTRGTYSLAAAKK